MEHSTEFCSEIEIKKEVVYEPDCSNWTSSATDGQEDTIRNLEDTKCGEILVSTLGNLTLVCVMCRRSFVNLQSFGLHIQSQHFEVQIDLNAVNPISLKVESTANNGFNSPSPDNYKKHGIKTESPTKDHPLTIVESAHLENRNDVNNADEYEHIAEPNLVETDPNNKSPIETINEHKKSETSNYNEVADTQSNFSELDVQPESQTEKRFACPFCQKRFTTRASEQSHINTHMGKRPHKCPLCPKAFADVSNLRRHKSLHSQIKQHKCKYCNKSFVRQDTKTLHERTHTGEKPYACPLCDKRFTSASSLNGHKISHNNTRSHKCGICRKAFLTDRNLRRHMLIHKKDSGVQVEISPENENEPYFTSFIEDLPSWDNEDTQQIEKELIPKDCPSLTTVGSPNLGNKTELESWDENSNDNETDSRLNPPFLERLESPNLGIKIQPDNSDEKLYKHIADPNINPQCEAVDVSRNTASQAQDWIF